MRFFDRYSRLRDTLRVGRISTGQKEILAFLKGRLSKADVPALVAEPASLEELRAVIAFAAEKHLKIAVAAGLGPVEVRDLEGQILLLTTRLTGASTISASRQSIRVDAGNPVEAMLVDLNRAGLRWAPLLPVALGSTAGEIIASGWEGLRTWRDGGLLSSVDAIEWVDFEGRLRRTGPAATADGAVDVSGFVHGSRGALGVITALEFAVQRAPATRTAMLYELTDGSGAVELLAALRDMTPAPETVVYWGETATQILREGNDGTVSDGALTLIAAEWRDAVRPPDTGHSRLYATATGIDALWQDLLRFPRTASRLYPERTGAKLRLPAIAVADLEDAARELGRDANLHTALWGTVEAGHFHVWVLHPDDQPRTQHTAEALLKRILEVAVSLGGYCAPGNLLPFDSRTVSANSRGSLGDTIRDQLLKRCDPHSLYAPVRKL